MTPFQYSLVMFARLMLAITLLALLVTASCGKKSDKIANQEQRHQTKENAHKKKEAFIHNEQSTIYHTLSGTVHLAGAPPRLEPFIISRLKKHCNPGTRPNDTLILTEDKGVVNAVVYVDYQPSLKTIFKEFNSPILDQNICTFIPHVQVAVLGSKLLLKNSDPTMHNVHSYIYDFDTYFSAQRQWQMPKERSVFNITLPFRKIQRMVTLSKPGLLKMVCDVGHTWMGAYIWVVEHPYYAVTDSSGHFTIQQVPEGKWNVKVWHEYLGNFENSIDLIEDLDIKFEYGKEAPSVLTRK